VNEAIVEKSIETRAANEQARLQVAARVKTYFRERKIEWEL
jgi:hypothetical protein